MGYLDDAIREHLELKRQHGAPLEDLERERTAALGPIESGDQLADAEQRPVPDEGQAEFAAEPDVDPVPDPDAPLAPTVDDDPDGDEAPSAFAEPLVEDDPVDQPTSAYSLDELDDDLAPDGARAHAKSEPRDPPPLREDIARAWRGKAEEKSPAEGEESDPEDVLEETPDFLQETPEHERLWFEQKPPKDFDF